MRVLLVHPSPLMYAEIYLRLEPLGLERVAQALRRAGHQVRLLDLQIFRHRDYFHLLRVFAPQAIGFSLNYLANVPEVIELAKATKRLSPTAFCFVGGHSASFIATDLLEQAQGALDCVLQGEGEAVAPQVLDALPGPGLETLPGVVTLAGRGPRPSLLQDLDRDLPARDLTRKRRKYFIGRLDPCASVEFTRGCPWDCAFCSAWTFYGRTYRLRAPEAVAEELAQIAEPHVFVVDDVAFIRPEHGLAIAQALEKRRIRKRYYLETRCDVLLRHQEVFARWKRLGLQYMFLGVEALEEEGLRRYRKRVTPSENFRALDVARRLGITVAINIIADPGWEVHHFQLVREWALQVPEIVHLTVNTPYPGTETWYTESRRLTTRDYRLFDVQHAVLPTRLPLRQFYEELVKTQAVLHRKHLGWAALRKTLGVSLGLLLRGQTNFVRMLWKFSRVYHAERQYRDHFQEVRYCLRLPPGSLLEKPSPEHLYIHHPSPPPREKEADTR
ncbi:MAG: hopanoid C-3 methylase HpnR [Nitrospinota bacterium]|nr:MAG: hopanoid C-3 methylase HpnR [Nitrospinota bacterium]